LEASGRRAAGRVYGGRKRGRGEEKQKEEGEDDEEEEKIASLAREKRREEGKAWAKAWARRMRVQLTGGVKKLNGFAPRPAQGRKGPSKVPKKRKANQSGQTSGFATAPHKKTTQHQHKEK